MKFAYIFCLIVFMTSCIVEPIPNNALAGKYNVIIDPIRCSLPSTKELEVIDFGNKIEISFDRMQDGKAVKITNIVAEIKPDGYHLFLDNKEIGKKIDDSYYDFNTSKTINTKILYLQFKYKEEFIEFMGAK